MTTKKIDIETKLSPNQGKLVIDKNGDAKAVILDEELDEVECVFNNDNCILLNTDRYTYLTFSISKLQKMIELIEKAEKHYHNYFK